MKTLIVAPDRIPEYQIARGERIYRLCKIENDKSGRRKYQANDFNPYYGVDFSNAIYPKDASGKRLAGRFSPFVMQPGIAVPVLYGAQTKKAAYYEYLIRPKNPKTSTKITINTSHIKDTEIATMSIDKPLRLADLRRIFFQPPSGVQARYSANYEIVFNDDQFVAYPQSRLLAKAIYSASQDLDGIAWDSVRVPNQLNIMLFRQNVNFTIEENKDIMTEVNNWGPDMLQELKNGTINITPELKQAILPSLL